MLSIKFMQSKAHSVKWSRSTSKQRITCPAAGENRLQAGRALRANILEIAGALLQSAPADLDIRNGAVVDADTGVERMTLSDVGKTVYFRGHELPDGIKPELVATRHYTPRDYPVAFSNAVQACSLEVDVETGFVKMLKYWVVEDCGTVVNPRLVAEQIRGGVILGIGAALYEHCTTTIRARC